MLKSVENNLCPLLSYITIMNTTHTGQANSTFDTQTCYINQILLLQILTPKIFNNSNKPYLQNILHVTYCNQ